MRFPGIIPAVTTPFDAAGAVDLDALERNLAALLDAGVHGFVATGTMGEAGSLSTRGAPRPSIEATVRAAAGRVPVIAGVSVGHAGRVDRATPPTPPRRAPTRSCCCRRSATAPTSARWSPSTARSPRPPGCPIMVYNNPEASGVDMPAALIARIAAEVEQVVAVKECSGDARRIPALLARRPTSRCSSAATTGRSRASAPARPAGSPASATARRPSASSSTRPAAPATSSAPARSTRGCCRSRGST